MTSAIATERAGGISTEEVSLSVHYARTYLGERKARPVFHSYATDASLGVVNEKLETMLLTPPARSVAIIEES